MCVECLSRTVNMYSSMVPSESALHYELLECFLLLDSWKLKSHISKVGLHLAYTAPNGTPPFSPNLCSGCNEYRMCTLKHIQIKRTFQLNLT